MVESSFPNSSDSRSCRDFSSGRPRIARSSAHPPGCAALDLTALYASYTSRLSILNGLSCCIHRDHPVSSCHGECNHLTRPLCSSPITGPSSLIRIGPSQCSASVLSPRGFGRLRFSLGIGATGSRSSVRKPVSDFTPPLRRSPPAQSSGTQRTCPRRIARPWFRRHLNSITTRHRRVHFRSSLGRIPAQVSSCFSSNAHHHGS